MEDGFTVAVFCLKNYKFPENRLIYLFKNIQVVLVSFNFDLSVERSYKYFYEFVTDYYKMEIERVSRIGK
jgi:hypothetical protein